MSPATASTEAGRSLTGESALWSLPAVVAVTLLFAALHIWSAASIEPYQDEAYYWWWGQYPALSYYDHPPMVAWWIALGTALFGDGPLGLRSMFILATVLGTAAIYGAGRILFDAATAARAAIWSNATLLIGVGGIFATPDAPATLFWTLAILALALVVHSGNGAWWLAVGLAAGLGLLSKYNVLFLGLGLVLAVVAVRDLRRWLATPWIWLGGLAALAVFLPVLVWNYQNDWASFAKQFGRITNGRELKLHLLADYIGVLIGLLNPLIALFAGLGVWTWLKGRGSLNSRIGILVLTTLPLLAYFAVHALYQRVEGNWLAPVFPTLALVAAAAAGVTGNRTLRWAANAVLPLGFGLSLIGTMVVVAPGDWHPPITDPGRMFRGWPAFTTEVEALRQENGAAWIATDDYNIAAELTYRLHDADVPVAQITERIRYGFAPQPDPELTESRALLLLRGREAAPYAGCLHDIVEVGTVARRGLDDDIWQRFTAYIAEGPAPDIFRAGCDGSR